MNSKRALLPLAIAILLIAGVASAQKPSKAPLIAMNADRQPIVQGEHFVFTIHVEANSEKDPDIKLPRFDGFRILRRSENHPVSFSFSFGLGSGGTRHSKKESNYQFVLVADKPGRHKIDSVTVVVNGKPYKGKPYIVDVLESGNGSATSPMPPTEPSVARPGGQADMPENPTQEVKDLDGAKYDKTFFVQTLLSKKEAVIGEPIVMTIYLYTTVNVAGLDVVREPGTEGFWVENLLEGNRRFTTEPVRVGNTQFGRGVLRKVVLFPIKAGKLTIAPSMINLRTRRGGFFSRAKSVKRAGIPVSVEVSNLPAENQPQGFNPANVGNFTFKAKVDNTSVKAGEPVILTLTVAGEGNIRNLELPVFEELEGFKVYAPESESNVRVQRQRVQGTKSSRVLMIPNEAGEYTIPAISWSFFNPKTQKYDVVNSRPQKVVVGQSQASIDEPVVESSGPVTTVAGQDRLNRQLKSIQSRSELDRNGDVHTLTRPWFLALIVLAPLAYFVVVFVSRTRKRIAEGNIKGRSKRAYSAASRKLNDLGKEAPNLGAEDFFAQLSRILVVFLEDRLETAVAGDTAVELQDRLNERGFAIDLAQKVVQEIEACDFARFAQSASKAGERKQALSRMEQLLKELAETSVLPSQEKVS